jgi:hypothetical protein
VVGGAAGLFGGAYVVRAFKPEPEVRIIERQGSAVAVDLLSRALSAASDERSAKSDQPATPAASVVSARTEPEPPRSQEELKQDWRQKFARKVDIAASEARDPAWAQEVEQAFQNDFTQQRGRTQAELLNVECKSSACLAHVQWPSYAVAKRMFPQIMHTAYATNCAVAIDIGDEPAEPDRPHQAAVVFKCKREGSEGSSGG